MIGRILRCLLRVASPSRVATILHGFAAEPCTWLDRWERRIDGAVAERMMFDAAGECGPYVCPGCYAVATGCATGCPEQERVDREDDALDRAADDDEWDDASEDAPQ